MTMIPPPPVAVAFAQATRAPGSGALQREPFQILRAWLLEFRARNNFDLEPALKNALPHGPPCCCMSLTERRDRLIEIVSNIADGKEVNEAGHIFLRTVLRTWVGNLGARMA